MRNKNTDAKSMLLERFSSDKEPTARFETITPEIARRFLDSGYGMNRNPSKVLVQSLVQAILTDAFKMNGESIIINEKGQLVDGQHRMLAVLEANKAVKMLVARGLSVGSEDTVDTGNGRKGSDVLTMKGFGRKFAGLLAMAAKREMTFNNNSGRFEASHIIRKIYNNHKLLVFVDGNPEIISAAEHIHNYHRRGMMISAGYIAWILYRARKQEPDLADTYIDQFITGLNIGEEEPAYVVREKLLRESQRIVRPLSPERRFAVVCRGWHYVKKGTLPKSDSNRWKDLETAFETMRVFD